MLCLGVVLVFADVDVLLYKVLRKIKKTKRRNGIVLGSRR